MKKLFATLLALAMLLSMAALAEASDFQGTWYLNEEAGYGVVTVPASNGWDLTMELAEDGTATMTNHIGEDTIVDKGVWEVKDGKVVVSVEGMPMTMALVDGNLVTEDTGSELKWTFGREPAAAELFAPAAPVAAALEDFAGSWKAYKYDSDGMYFDVVEALDGDLSATIEGTTLTMSQDLYPGEPVEMVFADGALTHIAVPNEEAEPEEGDEAEPEEGEALDDSASGADKGPGGAGNPEGSLSIEGQAELDDGEEEGVEIEEEGPEAGDAAEGGNLVIVDEDGNEFEMDGEDAGYVEDLNITVQLLEDGTMQLTLSANGMAYSFYMNRA